MHKVKGYNMLSKATKVMFNMIRHNHLKSMGAAEKEKHSIENLVSIKINREESCFEVQYKHEWYKYFTNGSWG